MGENRVLRAQDGMTGIRIFNRYIIPAGNALSQVKIEGVPQTAQVKGRIKPLANQRLLFFRFGAGKAAKDDGSGSGHHIIFRLWKFERFR